MTDEAQNQAPAPEAPAVEQPAADAAAPAPAAPETPAVPDAPVGAPETAPEASDESVSEYQPPEETGPTYDPENNATHPPALRPTPAGPAQHPRHKHTERHA